MMYLNTLLGLSFVIGMIMLLGFIMKKAGFQIDTGDRFKSKNGNLKIIEALRIDAKKKLVLFSCHNKNFLILTGDKDLLISDDINIDFNNVAKTQPQDEKA